MANLDLKNIARLLIDEWNVEALPNGNVSPRRSILQSKEYYRGDKTEIDRKTAAFIANGRQFENADDANFQIKSAFLKIFIDQKTSYAVGKPVIVTVDEPKPTGWDEITDKKLKDVLTDTFDISPSDDNLRYFVLNVFKSLLDKMSTDIYRQHKDFWHGQGVIAINMDKDDNLFSTLINPDSIIVEYSEVNPHIYKYLVRQYEIRDFTEENKGETIKKIEAWQTLEDGSVKCEFYTNNNGDLELDIAEMERFEGSNLQKLGIIPYLVMRSNGNEILPLLNSIKSVIDAHDELNSLAADSLKNDARPIKKWKGYTGNIERLIEQNLVLRKVGSVSCGANGDLNYLQLRPDVAGHMQKQNQLTKDLFRSGSAVNTQDILQGNNPSGVALKATYQEIDTAINEQSLVFKYEFEIRFKEIVYRWLDIFKGIDYNTIKMIQPRVDYNLDLLVNELEQAQIAVLLMQLAEKRIISYEFVRRYIQFADNETELQRLKDEQENGLQETASGAGAQEQGTPTQPPAGNQANNIPETTATSP